MSGSFFTYILKCSDGTYYIGHSDDLESRINYHQSGKAATRTATRLPVSLVYSETFPNRVEAIRP